MSSETGTGKSMIHIVKDDITNMEVDAFVFYARPDLKLGSGYGTAISIRGGPKIQEELDTLAPRKTGEAVTSGAGKLKAKFIIHAVGPAFQEEDIENKLRTTLENVLKEAAESSKQGAHQDILTPATFSSKADTLSLVRPEDAGNVAD